MARSFRATVVGGGLAIAACGLAGGCHDGPLYALKQGNPFFTMRQWRDDEKIGVTDHQRWTELKSLAAAMDRMSPPRQLEWSNHLRQIYANDASPEMRRLAVLAAGRSQDASLLPLIGEALDDESLKVRMEACRGLGSRPGDEPARMLATVLGSTQDKDVRHSAIEALALHPGAIANDALKLALRDRDPATQDLVMKSLRSTTGKNYGKEPENWIAALDGKPVEEQSSGMFGFR